MLAHVFAGIAIAAMLLPFGEVAAIAGYCIAAFAKEVIWDRMLRKGTADFGDAIATLAGGTIYLIWMRLIA